MNNNNDLVKHLRSGLSRIPRHLGNLYGFASLLALAVLLQPPVSALAAGSRPGNEPLIVYSARKEHLIKTVFERYTEKTGIPIELLTDSAGKLLTRLEAEGAETPADLLVTVDAGNLWQAAEKDLLRAVNSTKLRRNIPAHLRDPDNRWFGLSLRARTIIYHSERVNHRELKGYLQLASSRWKGRLCLRSGKKVYNRSLVASLLHHYGSDRTLRVLRGWVNNLSVPPFGSDTQTLEAMLAGRCDVAVLNTYYLGRMQRDWNKEGRELPLEIYWPEDSYGTHINISGAGVTRHAKHPKQAKKLLEWLSSSEAQAIFAGSNLEFPVNPSAERDPLVKAWGDFKADDISMDVLGRKQAEAARLIDQSGYR